ncbi:hypothetical protein [Aureimonas glaciei]|uniref:Uncharacterized protein n=1 Tax=Aureimonas glaciei TaxID=1776957 RepID=A0A916YGS3_9HYPH|nr:hypothetical protein [Aureimonas glaciei]GGD43872.1 hypothetical protein GCM10011335_53110 [Aureimonas glaciei]
MSYNPHNFCRGLEGAIQGFAMAAANAAAQERMIDRSGPAAVACLSSALRAERRLAKALAAELTLALDRLAEAEDELSMRPRGRR